MNDDIGPLDRQQICRHSFIRHVELHQSLPSTNDRALELAGVADLETPALVVARRQTAGRGRGGNRWWSADGALTFSLILDTAKLNITARDWPRLSLTTAVAVCDALSDCGLRIADCGLGDPRDNPKSEVRNPKSPLAIKWPNDVLLDGRKVCGILIESPGGTAPAKDRLIVGVGINVNNSWRDAPPDAGAAGTALCDVTGKESDRQSLLLLFLGAFERRLEQLASGDSTLPATWQALSYLTKREVEFDCSDRRLQGHCLGIADDAALLIRCGNRTERFYSGSAQIKSG
jgi:BirA family biotin operon repressor/biotin-[acetyl-CoA-carboxylase] ligase